MSSKQNLQDFSLCLQICIVNKRLLDALDRLHKIGF